MSITNGETPTKKQLIAKVRSIAENEKFKLDAFFLCGCPSGKPDKALENACEKYVEIAENGQPTEEDTMTLIAALEAALKVVPEVSTVNSITSSDKAVKFVLEHKDVLLA